MNGAHDVDMTYICSFVTCSIDTKAPFDAAVFTHAVTWPLTVSAAIELHYIGEVVRFKFLLDMDLGIGHSSV